MTAAPVQPAAIFAAPEYRVEGELKVRGRARYAADVQLPGMLWAAYLKSPLPHARIVSIDTSAAKAVPGVHAVLTHEDIGARRFGKVLYDCPVLAYDRVRYIGDRIAAVAAETIEAAEEAVNRIVVEYEELPPVFDAEAALLPDAPILHPDASEYYYAQGQRPAVPHPNLQGHRIVQKGEPAALEKAFAEAHLVVEGVYTTGRQHQGYIEPHACVVWIEADGTIQVVSTNKASFSLQQQLSRVIGVPAEQIVVDAMFIGGDFGGKGHSMDDYVCYFLAKATGRPIKSVMTYTDELVAGNPRNSSRFYLRTAVDSDGHILAHESRVYYDDGAYAAARPLPGPILEGWSALEPYRVPLARMETFLVYTNTVLGGQMRAPGAMHTSFAGECHVDDVAHQLGMDPLEFRLRNAIQKGDTTSANVLVREPRAGAVLEAIKRDSGWSAPLPPNHGRGLSVRSRHVGQGRNEVLMQLLPDGRIEILEGSPDQGGGAATVIQRVAAAVLSVDPEQITVRYGTTAEAPYSPGPGASRSTHILGQATIAGSISLKEKLEDRAADAMGWRVGTVQLVGNHFVVADGSDRGVPIAAVAPKILAAGPLEETGAYDSAAQHNPEGEDLNYCCYMIEVEVDPETGQVRPVKAVLAVDVGTIINPLGHQGQLEGGFVFGLGNALMEEIVISEDGRVVTANLGDYKLPTELDVPPLQVIHVPAIVGPGPFGAKSAGETANNAVAAAVANAVRSATGVPVTHAPISAERVLDALSAR